MATAHQLVTLNATTPTLVSIAQANEMGYERTAATSFLNTDAAITIYLGSYKDVNGNILSATSYGYQLPFAQAVAYELGADDQVYAIAASGTPKLAVFAIESI